MASYLLDVIFRKVEVLQYLPQRTFCDVPRMTWNHGVELSLRMPPDFVATFGLATQLAAETSEFTNELTVRH